MSFDRVADRYDESRGGRVRGEQHAAALEPELAAGGRTLEIGVGTGLVAAAFRQRGRDVVGIDISVEMLRRAHDRLGARVALADAERLPVRTGSVDNAYAVWVFHLVRDAAAVLREAARVLRPGGRLLVVTALDQGGDTDVDEVVSRVQLRLQPERSDHSDRLEQLGTDVGFRTGRRARVDSEPHEVTPTGYARAVEQRLYSMYWDLDDEVWRAVVEPALAELRALPDPDRPRQRVVRYDILCFDWDGRP